MNNCCKDCSLADPDLLGLKKEVEGMGGKERIGERSRGKKRQQKGRKGMQGKREGKHKKGKTKPKNISNKFQVERNYVKSNVDNNKAL